MKIVNREQFLAMPAGTIYAKGERWLFNGLEVKGESHPNDWWSLDPSWIGGDKVEDSCDAFDALEDMLKNGASYPMSCSQSRDGLFDEDDLFLIFEEKDLLELRGHIDTAIYNAQRYN